MSDVNEDMRRVMYAILETGDTIRHKKSLVAETSLLYGAYDILKKHFGPYGGGGIDIGMKIMDDLRAERNVR